MTYVHDSPEAEAIRGALRGYAETGGPGDPFFDASVALDSLLAYIKQLEGEREEAVVQEHDTFQKLRAAEAANERLREALEQIDTYGSHYTPQTDIARAALARTEEPRRDPRRRPDDPNECQEC